MPATWSFDFQKQFLSEVFFKENFLQSKECKKFYKLLSPSSCVFIVDTEVSRLHAERLQADISPFFRASHWILLEGGETHKTEASKQVLERALFQKGIQRDTLLVAIGGGVITDLVGYTASTYLRGVDWIAIPTTLMGMVDAALGGKTAVNTPYGKNLIGTFYPPRAVGVDPLFLPTLPNREWDQGIAEILKYSLIQNTPPWNDLEYPPANWRTLGWVLPWIEASIDTKMRLVQQDPFEKKGIRHLLNFGHTVGHAIEYLSAYQIPHGKAVALGTLAESWLSLQLGHLSTTTFERICRAYARFGFSWKGVGSWGVQEWLCALRRDKKNLEGSCHAVLLKDLGRPLIEKGRFSHPIPDSLLIHLIEKIEYDTSLDSTGALKRDPPPPPF